MRGRIFFTFTIRMLEVSQLKERKKEIIARLKIRNYDGEAQIDKVLELDTKRKSTQAALDQLLSQINSSSKEIGELFKEGKTEEANKLKEGAPALKEQGKDMGDTLAKIEKLKPPFLKFQIVPTSWYLLENLLKIMRSQKNTVISLL